MQSYTQYDSQPQRPDAYFHQPTVQPQNQPQITKPPSPQIQGYRKHAINGIIILLIGGLIAISAGFINDPLRPDHDSFEDNSEYQKASKEYYNKTESYKDQTRTVRTVGYVFQFIGLIFFSYGILIAAFLDNQLNHYTKIGLLIAWGIIIGFKIGGTFIYYSF